jgi:hypothetical protein
MLIDISGPLGTGKTLFMTWLASKVKDRPIYANYHLKMPNYRELKMADLLGFKNEQAIICIDEAYVLLESRNSMDIMNQYVSYILFQSRKRGLDFIVTAQLNSTLDLRYKELTDVFISAAKSKIGFQYAIKYAGRAKLFTLPFKQAEKIYPLYDTTELVIPQRMHEMVDEIENIDPEVLDRKVTVAVKKIELLDALEGLKRVTHDDVKNWLLEIREPSCSIEPYVYARLNANIRQREKQ